MDKFDIFVLPFTAGLLFVVSFFIIQVVKWVGAIPKEERKHLSATLKSPAKFFRYLREVVKESLLHINLFKTNPLLGFMHMSLAFGWFMLIICGNLESKVYTNSHLNPPYFPIFLKYFIPDMTKYPLHGIFAFIMDFFLALVLTGVMLAIIKRFASKRFSIAKKPKLTATDKVGLTALWLIFPCRLVAESIFAGTYHSGGFLTQTLGDFLYLHGVTLNEGYYAWWAYSCALGIFFFTVPFTRYMHILTEPFFIFVKSSKLNTATFQMAYDDIQAKSCSKCGVCLNACPLTISQIPNKTQPIYLLDALRKGSLTPDMADKCINCRRCEEQCPVGITIEPLRLKLKNTAPAIPHASAHLELASYPKAKIGLFAGCMGKLTPATTSSIIRIAATAGDKIVHIDKDGGICCGRPQILNGQTELAQSLIQKNRELFAESEIDMLVTSCPICLKAFRDEYKLEIPVLHHTEYISNLIERDAISLRKGAFNTTYHDPCELARGCRITKQPREILKQCSNLQELSSNIKAQCCGNSLIHSSLTIDEKYTIAKATLNRIPTNTQVLITSCPACNRAFKKDAGIETKDIAVFIEDYVAPSKRYSEVSQQTIKKTTSI